MTPYATAQQAYRDSAILTAPPERLVVMLYDGANRFLLQGAAAMRASDLTVSNEKMRRAEAIIQELRATLDMSAGPIAANLDSIYSFCQRLLLEGRLKKDAGKLDQVAKLLGELRDAWGPGRIAGMHPGYGSLVELAERELGLIERGELDALPALWDERNAIIAALPNVPPPAALDCLVRAASLQSRTTALLEQRMAATGAELRRLVRGRAAMNGYAPQVERQSLVDAAG